MTTFVIDHVFYLPANLSAADPRNMGSGDNQYTYSGSWTPAHSAGARSYTSSTAGDSYSIRFTGSQAYLVGAKGPHMGIVTVSWDGKQSATVDTYAKNEQAGALIYATPTLPNGEHTVTVINTGLLNSQELVSPRPASGAAPELPQQHGNHKPNPSPYVTADAAVIVPNSATVPAGNQAQNGDFETGELTPWYGQWNPSLAGVETTNPYEGKYDGYLHPNNSQDVGMQQDITIPQAGWYSLTANCATNLANDVQLGLNINGSSVTSEVVAANVGYAPYTIQFQAQAGQTISVWYYAGRQSGWATLDNVQIVSMSGPVPEYGEASR